MPLAPTARTLTRRKTTAATAKHRAKDTAADGARARAPLNPVGVAVLRFLMLSGWREREALTLRWDVASPGHARVTLTDTKSGRSVRELGAPALAVLDAMRGHAFASVAAPGGLTLPLIGTLLGHTDHATTARDAHLVDDARKRAAEQTAAAVAAKLAGPAAPPSASQPLGARVLPLARPA